MTVRPFVRLVLVLSLLGAASTARARDYWVDSKKGTDSSACTGKPSASKPCKSISHVIKNGRLVGSTVHVAAGDYFERLEIEGRGSQAERTTFVGEGGPVILFGLDPAPLDDSKFVPCTAAADCNGDGKAYPRTYRLEVEGRGPVEGVYELNWKPLRIDDSETTGVVFDFTEPMQYKRKKTVPEVDNLPGSFLVGGSTLYVHTFFDENPAAARLNLETRKDTGVGVKITGSHVSFVNFTLRYFDSGLQIAGKFIEVRGVKVHSGNGIGLDLTADSSDCTVTDTEVSHFYRRRADDDSWLNKGGGTGFNVKGTRHTLRTISGWNSWNVFSGTMTHTLVEDAFIKNSPNHTFILASSGLDDDCHDNVIRRSVAMNGQDEFFIRGCRNTLFTRNQGGMFLDDGAVTGNRDTTQCRLRSNTTKAIYIGNQSAPGFDSDFNWLDDGKKGRCRKGKDIRNCREAWQELGYDKRSVFAPVKMANATWPIPNGLTASMRWRRDFLPLADSSLVDKGDPDLDGDGTLETGPGGDDECTLAHHCAGAGPDIGPYELGIPIPPQTR